MIGKNQTPDIGKATQFKPGTSGNPAGKPLGTMHLSTHIQKLLNDPEFVPEELKEKGFEGTPMKAIIITAIKKANGGDNKWADWLAKHGFGEKHVLANDPDSPINHTASDAEVAAFTAFLKQKK